MLRAYQVVLVVSLGACDHDDYSFRDGSMTQECTDGDLNLMGQDHYLVCEDGEWSERRECLCSEYYDGLGALGADYLDGSWQLVCAGQHGSYGPCPPEDTGT